MQFERATMERVKEIERLIKLGLTDRKIATTLHCRRKLVSEVRSKRFSSAGLKEFKAEAKKQKEQPIWQVGLDWSSIEKEISKGYEIKKIWTELAADLTSYANFYKVVQSKFEHLLKATVTLRQFEPGTHCEVDYAGNGIDWLDIKTGEIKTARIFVGVLCFSQKLFAYAAENEKKENWILSHRQMFESFGGVPRIVVCDQLKNGVQKSHLYDPDLNPDYVALAEHYGTAIVPARVRHPKDKALVEGSVKILMRYFTYQNRRRTFCSLQEVNAALKKAVFEINKKPHSRFKVSREERFNEQEKAVLKALPSEPFSFVDWRVAKVHPDCTIAVAKNFYSVPHIYRGKEIRVRRTDTQIAAYVDLNCIAIHTRVRGKLGERVIDLSHLPENSKAYIEATPQAILSRAKFINLELYNLIDELFQTDALKNLRRAQGLVRKAYSVIEKYGQEKGSTCINAAIKYMRLYSRTKVQQFEEQIQIEVRKLNPNIAEQREIIRKPGNIMLRGLGTATSEIITKVLH